jgi:histidine triad (HIT) family protein
MDCIFCKIASGEIESELLHEDDQVVAFRDINPAAPFHVLVIPREHIARASDASEAHAELLGRMQLVAAKIAESGGISDYRLVTNCGEEAGQAVFHLHLHVLGGRRMTWPPG